MTERAAPVVKGPVTPAARGPLGAFPSPGGPRGRLLGLQMTIGNRAVVGHLQRSVAPDQTAVQRDPVITAYDLNTDKGGPPSDAVLNLGQLRAALQVGVTNPRDRTKVLQYLTEHPDVQAADVAALATLMANGLGDRTRREVEDTVGNLLQGVHLYQWSEGEAAQNDDLLRAPDATLSRAKGTANTIPVATLDRVTGGDFAGRMAAVKGLDARSYLTLSYANAAHLSESFLLNHLSGDIDVRSCHTNGAQWLPLASTTARYQALDTQINNLISFQAKKRDKPLSDFRFMGINKLPPKDRRDFLWTAHCQQFLGSPYVEFSVPGKKDLRLVYQCLTGDFYATVHYKWQRGYNPFFRIT